MTRGVRLYLVGSIVLVSLSGCGRGFFQTAEREPWRAEAEIACLKSGTVKESAEMVRIEPIEGPGVCGADYPLKVAALGEANGAYGFADDDMRPPANIGNQPRWPVSQPPPNASQAPAYPQQQAYPPPQNYPQGAQPGYGAPSNGPISLTAPGVPANQSQIDLPPDGEPYQSPAYRQPGGQNYPTNGAQAYPPRDRYGAPPSQAPDQAQAPRPPLGPAQGNPVVGAVGPVAVKPAATLACPIVSVLDHWLDDSVQPAAMRWFGSRVVAIKQISAYSCRGMNGNPNAHISEHAFGNALDIAAFTFADGRTVTVEHGWHGLPEEQGFLRDVQGAACQQFTTVLAPGSNVYHYNHIHVDLMRRATRRFICEPAAVSGQEVAARAAGRNPYASRDPYSTGSLGGRKPPHRKGDDDDSQDD
jgi:Extensin-like protein C-terminus